MKNILKKLGEGGRGPACPFHVVRVRVVKKKV